MKRILWVVVLMGTLLLVACGPSEPPIELPAAEMNLELADLPAGFRQTEELGLTQIVERINLSADEKGAVKDASMRTFVLSPAVTATAVPTTTAGVSTTQVIATVLRFDSEGNAQNGANELVVGFGDAVRSVKAVGATPEVLTAPQVGTSPQFLRLEVSEKKAQAYLLVFYKRNVVGMVLVSGPAGQVEDLARSLGQALDKGIALPPALSK